MEDIRRALFLVLIAGTAIEQTPAVGPLMTQLMTKKVNKKMWRPGRVYQLLERIQTKVSCLIIAQENLPIL